MKKLKICTFLWIILMAGHAFCGNADGVYLLTDPNTELENNAIYGNFTTGTKERHKSILTQWYIHSCK